MPHQVHLRTFGRETAHRQGMLRNLTLSVLRYEKVKTTEAKAKEVRRLVDRMIGLGKDGSLGARRRALGFLPEPVIVEKLFADLAPRFSDRTSGYTRTTHVGRRVGDNAPLMLIELMPGVDQTPAVAAQEVAAEAKPRRRLALPGRRKKAEDATERAETAPKSKKSSTARKTASTEKKSNKGVKAST